MRSGAWSSPASSLIVSHFQSLEDFQGQVSHYCPPSPRLWRYHSLCHRSTSLKQDCNVIHTFRIIYYPYCHDIETQFLISLSSQSAASQFLDPRSSGEAGYVTPVWTGLPGSTHYFWDPNGKCRTHPQFSSAPAQKPAICAPPEQCQSRMPRGRFSNRIIAK